MEQIDYEFTVDFSIEDVSPEINTQINIEDVSKDFTMTFDY